MAIISWLRRWDALRRACEHRKATGRWAEGASKPPSFEVAPPASERDLIAMEARLKCAVPSSFRNVLMRFSRSVDIRWALPDDAPLPEAFRQIFAGECRWDLASLPTLLETYRGWLTVFSDPNDIWDAPWHNKFPVLEVGNGDMIAIDLSDQQAVVYLSHEGDDSVHGYWLGRDFEDYIDRLSQLGCVGSEDWQLKPFVSSARSLLETNGENAKHWREWFGLHLPADDD